MGVGLGIRDYTQALIEAWSPKPAPADKFLAHASDGRSVFVVVGEDDNPIAFIELEANGHIDFFYCHPDVVGTGVGSALYERLESAALEMGLSRLRVEASEAARRFFIGKGFRLIRRRDFLHNGAQIHNYQMEKSFLQRLEADLRQSGVASPPAIGALGEVGPKPAVSGSMEEALLGTQRRSRVQFAT